MNERLKDSALVGALSDVVGDLAELFQKEMRLAKIEVAGKISQKLRAGVWMSISGGIGFLAAMVFIEAAVFAIASYGIALHWSCIIVAAALAVLGAAAYAKGRADAGAELTPTHTLHQVQRDIATAKEQLS
jgi:VIT1/CCC1 family predicted Fe2+/Mn2+ transporter